MADLYRAFSNDDSVLDVSEVVALEQRIASEGTPLKELMRRAGTATAQVVIDRVPAGSRVLVLAGSGNNGGDGWVAADVLVRAGYEVVLVSAKRADELRAEPAAETAKEICQNGAPFEIRCVTEGANGALADCLAACDVVLDCILGTGFEGASVREPYGEWIEAVNAWRNDRCNLLDSPEGDGVSAASRFLLAVDTPSGYSAQSGMAAQQCIQADATITMIVGKTGLLADGAEAYTGELLLAPLV